MKEAMLKVYSRNREPIGERRITAQQVRRAIKEYDRQYPANDYPRTGEGSHSKTWFENKTFVFALRYRGKCYPPKPILRLAIGSALGEGYRFFGGSRPGRANWVLAELGFEVILKSQCERRAHVQAAREAPAGGTPERKLLAGLRQILVSRLDEGELRTLCFDLGVDYDNLPGEGKANKARELVIYLERRNRIGALVETGKSLRPDIAWVETAKH